MNRQHNRNEGLPLYVVHGVTYEAYLHRGLIMVDNRPCMGICDHDRYLMLVADSLRDEEILGVICHEYWHAFERAFPGCFKTQEGRADLFAIATRQFLASTQRFNLHSVRNEMVYWDETVRINQETPTLAAFNHKDKDSVIYRISN